MKDIRNISIQTDLAEPIIDSVEKRPEHPPSLTVCCSNSVFKNRSKLVNGLIHSVNGFTGDGFFHFPSGRSGGYLAGRCHPGRFRHPPPRNRCRSWNLPAGPTTSNFNSIQFNSIQFAIWLRNLCGRIPKELRKNPKRSLRVDLLSITTLKPSR